MFGDILLLFASVFGSNSNSFNHLIKYLLLSQLNETSW